MKGKCLRYLKEKINQIVKNAKKYSIANNLLIGFLIICVAFACLYPFRIDGHIEVDGVENKVIRRGVSSDGVSLMFNVYSDTKSVERILEVLSAHNAKATFFIGGSWADDNISCLKKIIDNGHELGNHGYFHKDHPSLNKEQNQKEMSLCNEFIEKSVGVRIGLFAPPSGAYDEQTVVIAENLGMKTIMWSKDTIDWRDKSSAIVYTRATKNVKGGDFVLMHPTPHTADALSDILKYYESCKLRAITVSENLQEGG